MARYQVPPDPREGDENLPHAHKIAGRGSRSSPPWLWIGLGAIVTVLAIAVAVLWAQLILDVEPLNVAPTPTITFQTAVPTTPAPTPTVELAEPQVTQPADAQPTSQAAPTAAAPPTEVAIGVKVIVAGTDGIGISLRAGPGTDYARLDIRPDGDLLDVIDGPTEGGGYTWWFLRAADGSEGWAVADFLQLP